MAYYQGDYYVPARRRTARGDYYRGDPGLLGFFKGIGKGLLAFGKAQLGLPAAGAAATGATPPFAMSQLPLRLPGPGGFTPAPAPIMRMPSAQRGQILRQHVQAPGAELGVPRRRQRMNVLNAKALRRSMRRVEGFATFAKRTIQFTSKVRMKKRRKRA